MIDFKGFRKALNVKSKEQQEIEKAIEEEVKSFKNARFEYIEFNKYFSQELERLRKFYNEEAKRKLVK